LGKEQNDPDENHQSRDEFIGAGSGTGESERGFIATF
jgi:hypothetical protein